MAAPRRGGYGDLPHNSLCCLHLEGHMATKSDLFPFDSESVAAAGEKLTSHFRSLVTWHLPDDSRVLAFAVDEDLYIVANWPLHGEHDRPRKRSRTLKLVISSHALENYLSTTREAQLRADIRFTEWLRSRWRTLDGNHDAPPGAQPAEVIWFVDSVTLSG